MSTTFASNLLKIHFSIPLGLLLLLWGFASCKTQHTTKRGEYEASLHMKHSDDHHYSYALKGLEKILVEEALSWLGTPYVYAGQEKGIGADCSGMVMVVFNNIVGCDLPRNSAKQAEYCKEIAKKHVKPGDLVFFATGKDPSAVSHVGMMIDNENFVHASSTKGVVISNINTDYYIKRFIKYGRVPCLK